MHEMLRALTRMDAVQAPMVAVVGDMIRQVPGTISLGQGVVHYGPPQAAIDAARAALTDPRTHQYQGGAGLPAPADRLASTPRAQNGLDRPPAPRLRVT